MNALKSVSRFHNPFEYVKHKGNISEMLYLYSKMCENGVDSFPLICNIIISTFLDHGETRYAEQVFGRLLTPDEHSWNLLIVGYVKCGEYKNSITMYRKMQHNDILVRPSGHTIVALLKACTRLKAPEEGLKLYEDIVEEGLLENDIFICSALVHMFSTNGLLTKAQEVFDKITERDIVLWNSLITAYADYGFGEKALLCIEEMHKEGISLNPVTVMCCLKASGNMKSIKDGEKLHAEIIKQGLESNVTICNSLVDMYAKCGLNNTAKEVFGKILVKDVVSWNSLISGYLEKGPGDTRAEQVLSYFEQMQEQGISPDDVTFLCCLKACTVLKHVQKGYDIHSMVVIKGLESQYLLSNTLVDMYARCGMLTTAEEVLAKLSIQDVIAWNELITGYADYECPNDTFNCFKRMLHHGVTPDAVSFVCTLKVCDNILIGQEIHSQISKIGLEKNILVGSTLSYMYSRCGFFEEALEIFYGLPIRTIISWNALMTGYAKNGCGEEALRCLEQMQSHGMTADAVTLVCALKACACVRASTKCLQLHSEIVKKGKEVDLQVGNSLVDIYCKCNLLTEAQAIFDTLSEPDVVSWSSLVAGYAEAGYNEEALQCLETMQKEGISLSSIAFVCILKACGATGAIIKGQELHTEVAKRGLDNELMICNMLVDMYANCGSLTESQELFEALSSQEVDLWNVLITGYAQIAKSDKVLWLFDRMLEGGVNPNSVTFVSALNACSHAGMVQNGFKCFEMIRDNSSSFPTLKHLTCFVDLLARAGLIEMAIEVITNMPVQPDLAVWLMILGACRKWGNVELGIYAFQHAIEFGQSESAAYICMLNIHVDAVDHARGNS